jgi:asparagine synthase (glutamine-hydrolysing)
MSVQFGRWTFSGQPADQDHVARVNSLLAPYGPDDHGSYTEAGVTMLYYAFHATEESRRETQPHISRAGAVITWDGRLDNREEFLLNQGNDLTHRATDVEIVADLYDKWGTDCFAKLLGDWALAIWDPNIQSVILTVDFAGTRHLCYSADKDQITWSTILDPLVLLAEECTEIDEEYIAGWLGSFPEAGRTPYCGVRSVPPSCYVQFQNGRLVVHRYWSFDARRKVRYQTDREYEEHFRSLFAQSVRRRVRSHAPVLAELSGGVDSSSIVCMADALIAQGYGTCPQVDTVSFHHDAEANWNERPFFSRIEKERGREGHHIPVNFADSVNFQYEQGRFSATPGAACRPGEAGVQFLACLRSGGYRVVLSGVGGDEVLGGVPNPTVELADLLARFSLLTLTRQLKVWSLAKRKPLLHLLANTLKTFLPVALVGVSRHKRPVPWLDREFVRRNLAALQGYPTRLKLFGAAPSFTDSLSTLDALRRQLACSVLPCAPHYERRYPYLDRDLLEFLYAVPREQLLRPNQRRSLMRRALAGIVPHEILDRKRKAFVACGPLVALSANFQSHLERTRSMICGSLGFVNSHAFAEALQKACLGGDVPLVSILRTLGLESWIRHMSDSNFWISSDGTSTSPPRHFQTVRRHRERRLPLILNTRAKQWGRE